MDGLSEPTVRPMAYAVTGVFAIAPVDSFKSRKLGNMWLKVIRRDDKSVI